MTHEQLMVEIKSLTNRAETISPLTCGVLLCLETAIQNDLEDELAAFMLEFAHQYLLFDEGELGN